MLIEFRVTNYRSIRETQTLSLVANAGREHLDTHTSQSGLRTPGRLLRCAIIYGPNAAGKTNVIRALEALKNLVVGSAVALPTAETPHDPFKLASETRREPSVFEVSFVQEEILYEYGVKIAADRVHEEWLREYPVGRGRDVFTRKYNPRQKDYNWKFSNTFRGNRSLWRDSTRENALFLSTAAQLNSIQLLPVFAWFQQRLLVVSGIGGLNSSLTLRLLSSVDGKRSLLPFVRRADPGIADVEIKREAIPGGFPMIGGIAAWPGPNTGMILDQAAPNQPLDQVTITFAHETVDDNSKVNIDLFQESAGTRALFMAAGALLQVLQRGEILLFDEIDTSLHPLLTRFLIGHFHSSDTNTNSAQLICTTHDTTLLDLEVFRRDQIWFVEKGEDKATKLFPLSDFSPRKDDSLEKAYLRGRYGALPILRRIDP